MRKSIPTIEEKADNLQLIQKITKHIGEGVRRVDASVGSAGGVGALFSPQALAARGRLRESCERAILANPPNSSTQRFEEIIWRKVYYEPCSIAKKMRKGNNWSMLESSMIWAHLNDGICYYHHLLQNFTPSHYRNSEIPADFLPLFAQDDDPHGVTKDEGFINTLTKESILRCLTCLGDLARYTLDLPGPPFGQHSYLLPVRYYYQYLHYNREGGLIHSNLASIYSCNDQPLLAAIHYLRALTCEKSFEAADGNLKKMLEKSQHWLNNPTSDMTVVRDHLKKDYAPVTATKNELNCRFLHNCLYLISSLITNTTTEEVAGVCQDVLLQLASLLDSYDDSDNVDGPDGTEEIPAVSTDNNDDKNKLGSFLVSFKNQDDFFTKPTSKSSNVTFLLTPDSMVAVCGLFVVCVKRLKNKGSPHKSMAEVFLVSLLLTLVNHVNSRLEQRISLIDPAFLTKLMPADAKKDEISEKERNGNVKNDVEDKEDNIDKATPKKSQPNRLSRLRRRKRPNKTEDSTGANNNSEGSESDDMSDAPDEESDESDDDLDPDVDELDMSQLCSSEDDSDYDVKIESDQEWDGITAYEHLQMIGRENMLSAVYVVLDWLSRSDDVMNLCVKTAHSLWTALAKLLNLIAVDVGQLYEDSSGLRKEVVRLVKEHIENTKKVCDKDDETTTTTTNSNKQSSKLTPSSLELTPLPEDLTLYSVIPSFVPHSANSLNIKPSEMVLLRLSRLNNVGTSISARCDCPLWYEEEKYIVSKEKCTEIVSRPSAELGQNGKGITIKSSHPNNKNNNDESNGRSNNRQFNHHHSEDKENVKSSPARRLEGMQSLTAQWLQHEVRNLEERTRKKATLGLYLVPDTAVLINHLSLIKSLLANPTHMVIIPQIVIDSLDQLKRDSLGARDAIRWLEIKLHHGSRFLRAQRTHERSHIPLMKYPKRKDKEAWYWFQMVECCNYLGAQVQHTSKSTTKKTSTVTLLTGEDVHTLAAKLSFSPSGLVQTTGAVLQNIDGFVRKWQNSTKGHS